MQLAVAWSLLVSVTTLQYFFKTYEHLWLIVTLIALGSAISFFTESIMVLYNPLSLFASWAKLLAVGMAFQMAGGIAAFISVFAQPQPVSDLMRDYPLWVDFGPSLFLILTALLTMSVSNYITSRILCYNAEPSIGTLFIFPATIFTGMKLIPALMRHQPIKYWISDEFWDSILGAGIRWPLILAYLAGVSFARWEQQQVKHAHSKDGRFHSIFWTAAGAVPPLLAMLFSGYLLIWIRVKGGWPFAILTVVISIALCRFPFRWILHWAMRWRVNRTNLIARQKIEKNVLTL